MTDQTAISFWFHKKRMKLSKRKETLPQECGSVNRLKIILEYYDEFISSATQNITIDCNGKLGMYAYFYKSVFSMININ